MKIGMWSECVQLSHQHLIQCPAHYRCSIKICWINEWASDLRRYWLADISICSHPSKFTWSPSSFLFISAASLLALAASSPYLEIAGWLSYLQLLHFSYYSSHLSTVVFLMCRSVQDTPLLSAVASIALSIKFKLSNKTVWVLLDLPPVNSSASPLHTPPLPPFLTFTFFLCFWGELSTTYSFSQGHALLLPLYLMFPWLGTHWFHLANSRFLFRSLLLQKLFLNPKSIQNAPSE